MLDTNDRLKRIERELRKQRIAPGVMELPERLTEKEAIAKYGIGHERLRQLRVGTWHHGRFYPPVLFKWSHVRNKRITYDAAELAAYFQPEFKTQQQ